MQHFINYDLTDEIAGRSVVAVMCSGGFTSSMMAQRMQKHVDKLGLPIYVMYASIQALETEDFMSHYGRKIRVVFVSPQVQHYFEYAKKAVADYPMELLKIEFRDFGTMNYEKLVDQAQQVMASQSVELEMVCKSP
ncbi:PTS sugar transporter subunit IIB [Vibrio intestinalis]|uniref:PTS sugar transporter subunit IIB n=1 Tax=Vibrio intestinalis TaxID=2933291 RepID=UPI0021A8291A|nr:hypothetical protein [Vibrio intestinalis]